MAAEFLLDFDQVAQAGRNTRHRPTFPVAQFEYACNPNHRADKNELVKERKRFHHNGWFLPLLDSYVRTWLKKVRFSRPPVVVVSGVEVECGKLVEPPTPEEIATWVQHYDSGFFSLRALEAQLSDLEQYTYQFSYGKEYEREPRLWALRQLLGKEAPG